MTGQSEDDFARAVREYAKLNSWLTYHTHRSDRSEPGFPNEVYVRGSRLIFAELKRDNAAPRVRNDEAERRPEWLRDRSITNAQAGWLESLDIVAGNIGGPHCAGSVDVYIWTPSDWPEIKRVLAR